MNPYVRRNVAIRRLMLGMEDDATLAGYLGITRQAVNQRAKAVRDSTSPRQWWATMLVCPVDALEAHDPTVIGSVPVPNRPDWLGTVVGVIRRGETPTLEELQAMTRLPAGVDPEEEAAWAGK